MGTKLEYNFRHLGGTTSSANSKTSFTVHERVNEWPDYITFQNRSSSSSSALIRDYTNHTTMSSTPHDHHKIPDSANRMMLKKTDVESIRNTMQIHEDVFNFQVKELHRLYSVQKRLMDDVKKEMKQKKLHQYVPLQDSTPPKSTSNASPPPPPPPPLIGLINFNLSSSCRERSGSCSAGDHSMKSSTNNNINMSKGFFDQERPAPDQQEDISTRISTATDQYQSAGPSRRRRTNEMSSQIDDEEDDYEDKEVELTLSIGGSFNKKRSKIGSKEEETSDPNTQMSSSSAATICDQQVTTTATTTTTRPHWLFQGLKLT